VARLFIHRIGFVRDTSANPPRLDTLRGIVYMLLCVLLFAVMDALVKLAAEHHPTGSTPPHRSGHAGSLIRLLCWVS
jgi:hypothetical protein